MIRSYQGDFVIIDYLRSHQQLLLGSEDTNIYLMFKGVVEINISDHLENITVESMLGSACYEQFPRNLRKYHVLYNCYKISRENYSGYILAGSLTVYKRKGFLCMSIEEFSEGELQILDEFDLRK